MIRRLSVVAVGASALLLAGGAAHATVAFDPATGTGFVGKGDVQMPFGWNDKVLQSNAGGVDFVYSDLTEYEVTCQAVVEESWTTETGGKNSKTIVHTRKVPVRSVSDASTSVAYDTVTDPRTGKKTTKITGFNIKGMAVKSSEAAPAEGDTCSFEDETYGLLAGKLNGSIVVLSTDGDTLTATHDGQNKSAVVWTDGVSALA